MKEWEKQKKGRRDEGMKERKEGMGGKRLRVSLSGSHSK